MPVAEPERLTARSVRFGDFALDLQTRELARGDDRVRLADQPFQILSVLLERHGEVVTREELRRELWSDDTFVDFDRSLNSAIRKLRDALGDSADKPRYIETIPRVGYRLIASSATQSPVVPLGRPASVRRWVGAAAVAVAVLGTIGFVSLRPLFARRVHSVAVLPLANLSGDPAQEYFADGMTDALITELAQASDLLVISRTSVIAYKGSRKSLREIAHELGADAIVEGTIVRSGSRVRVTAQLIEAATDHHLWAQSYERNLDDVLALQRDLSLSIANAVHAHFTGASRASASRPIDPRAYDLLLKGTASEGRETAAAIQQAIGYFEQAVTLQPDFALGYAALVRARTQFVWSGTAAPAEREVTKALAWKALALDPGLPQAHTELARVLYFYDWNWSESEKQFRRALELNANDVEAHSAYGMLLRLLGRDNEAEVQSEYVRRLDPLTANSAETKLNAAMRLRRRRDYDRAIAEMRRVMPSTSSFPRVHFQLGWTLAEAGRMDEGIRELETAVSMAPANVRFRARLAWAYARAGRQDQARVILAELIAQRAKSFVSPAAIALIHVALHNNSRALDALEEAVAQHDFEFVTLTSEHAFDSLRSEPRFRELIHKLQLPEA